MASSEHRIAMGTQVSRLACYLFPPLGSVCKPRDASFIYCFCHKGVLLVAWVGSSASGMVSAGEYGLASNTL